MAARRGKSQARRNSGSQGTPGWVWLVAGVAIAAVVFLAAPNLFKGEGDGFLRAGPQPNPNAQPAPVADADSDVGTQPAAQPATPKPAEAEKPAATQYDFYTLLPGSEVAVPPEAVPPAQTQKPQTPPTVVATKEEAEKIDTQRALAALSGQNPPPPAVVKPATPATPPATQVASAQKQALPQAPASDTAPAKPTPPPAVAATQYYLQAGSFRKQTDADHLRAQIIMMGQNARVESGTVRDETWYRVMVGPYGDRAKASAAQKQLAGNGFSNLLLQQRQTR